jgi:hypothetical protein
LYADQPDWGLAIDPDRAQGKALRRTFTILCLGKVETAH